MIDKTAIIDSKAKLDKNVQVGPYCVIGPNVEIWENTVIQSHVNISGNVKIGKGNKIYHFVSINDPQDLKYAGEPTNLIIGDYNKIREYVTINPGTIGGGSETKIGNNCLFMISSHVAHDCIVGDNNVFANNAGLAGHVIIGDFVVMGGYSAVHQFCRLGDHSFVGMNTSITMDIPAFLKAASNPARILGLNSVGMTRNEISNDSISILKKALKLVYKKQLKLDEAIKGLEIMLSETNSIHLETFIKSIQTSSRGILR